MKRGQKAVGQCELALSDLQPDTRANLPPAVVMNKAQAADAERVGPVCDSVRSAKFRAMVLLHGRRAGYVQGRVYVYAIDRLRTAVRCCGSPVLCASPYKWHPYTYIHSNAAWSTLSSLATLLQRSSGDLVDE